MGKRDAPVKSDVGHPMQSIMSRAGSFPLRTAYSALQQFGGRATIILDPFCGKGTSLLAARLLGSAAYGIDTAPEAIVCARAKLATTSLDRVERFLAGIRLGRPYLDQVPREVRLFFHPDTLR
ncbi:MAG: DNA methyltransferase, partial [Blastocatellia bacterium]